jgi:molybdate transport system substrate-binding protein
MIMEMNKIALTFAVFFALIQTAFGETQVNIAVSANMRYSMEEITASFSAETGIKTEIISGSSGALTAQISAGAPYDVLVSADMAYPQKLCSTGNALRPPTVYAFGNLILWTTSGVDLSGGLRSLISPAFKKIALPNPDTAPYGVAAVEAMKNAGIYDEIKAKLVYAGSVSQANRFIFSRSAEAGFTSKSSALAPDVAGAGKWVEVDSSLYRPIAQGITLLKHSQKNSPEAAKRFFDFMFSDKAKNILSHSGYRLP